jgi:hypothetical protein
VRQLHGVTVALLVDAPLEARAQLLLSLRPDLHHSPPAGLIVDLEERLRRLSGSNDTAPFSTGILFMPLSRHQRAGRHMVVTTGPPPG